MRYVSMIALLYVPFVMGSESSAAATTTTTSGTTTATTAAIVSSTTAGTTTTTISSGSLSVTASAIYNRLIANGRPHNEAFEIALTWHPPMVIPGYDPQNDDHR